jgi:hypothetical protein
VAQRFDGAPSSSPGQVPDPVSKRSRRYFERIPKNAF